MSTKGFDAVRNILIKKIIEYIQKRASRKPFRVGVIKKIFDMAAEFNQCPNCFNSSSGTPVYKCDGCGKICCKECYTDKCPVCGREEGWLSSNWSTKGYIK